MCIYIYWVAIDSCISLQMTHTHSDTPFNMFPSVNVKATRNENVRVGPHKEIAVCMRLTCFFLVISAPFQKSETALFRPCRLIFDQQQPRKASFFQVTKPRVPSNSSLAKLWKSSLRRLIKWYIDSSSRWYIRFQHGEKIRTSRSPDSKINRFRSYFPPTLGVSWNRT